MQTLANFFFRIGLGGWRLERRLIYHGCCIGDESLEYLSRAGRRLTSHKKFDAVATVGLEPSLPIDARPLDAPLTLPFPVNRFLIQDHGSLRSTVEPLQSAEMILLLARKFF